jgi:hypothetical protein
MVRYQMMLASLTIAVAHLRPTTSLMREKMKAKAVKPISSPLRDIESLTYRLLSRGMPELPTVTG